MKRALLRLGLPLDDVAGAWAGAAIVLVVYAATLARDLTFYDSPELALVAHELGLGHPLGQPLHTWLGFLFSRAFGVIGLGAMSAIFGALAIVPAYALAERLAGMRSRLLLVPLIGAALHPVAWEPATRIEVYTLASFFALWAVARASEPSRTWPIGLALGLSASAHVVIAAAHALALAPRLVRLGGRQLAMCALAFVAGLVPYVHLLLVGADVERFVWGAPARGGLVHYLSGADYAHNAGIGAGAFFGHWVELGEHALFDASLPVALVGVVAYFVRANKPAGLRWALPIAALLCIAFVARNVVFHPDVPDYRGYFLAPWLAAAAGLAALAALLFGRGARFRIYGGVLAALPFFALAISPGHLLCARDTPSLARAMIDGALGEAPRNAILVVESDHWVGPLLYAQEAEHRAPDVAILPEGLASSSWYWEHLFARHPTLARMPLRGAGGRQARIQRFLDANRDRAVLFESWSSAQRAHREPCGVGWLVWTRCDETPSPRRASARIDRIAPSRGEALEVAGQIGMMRGEALFRLGRADDAYRATLAGIDAALPAPAPHPLLPEAGPALSGALPTFSRRAAIHDPARNLLLATFIMHANGHPDEALVLLDLADRMGLPEVAALRGTLLLPPR